MLARLRASYVGRHIAHLGRRVSLLLGGAGILTLVGIIQLIRGSHHVSVWFWLFSGALLIAVAEGSAVHRDMHAGPQLQFVGTEAADAVTFSTAGPAVTGVFGLDPPPGGRVVGGPAPSKSGFVRVCVANDPGQRIGECARHVAATIAFLDDSDRPLMPPMVGRWAETPQRAETGRFGLSLEEAQLDIEANGLPHSLDVAMKVPGQTEFYAYNHENSGTSDLRLGQHRLDVAECRVQITLRPANARSITGTFLLRNDSEGLHLTKADDAPRVRAAR